MSTTAAPLFTLPTAEPGARPRRPLRGGEPAPRPRSPLPAEEPRGARVHRLAYGRQTLDELVSGAWAAVASGAPVACPVCDGALRRHPSGASAECGRCGAELA